MDKNILGNKIKWIWTMRKLNTPLSVSSYPEGVKMGQKFFQYPAHLTATWYDHGDIYFDEEEIHLIREFLRYKIKNDASYPNTIAKRIFSLAKTIDRHEVTMVNKKTPKQLVAFFKNEEKLFLQMIGFMSYRGSIQMSEILREHIETLLKYKLAEIKSLHSFQTCLDALSFPLSASVIAEEKKYALELAMDFQKISKAEQEKRIHCYLEKFEWLSFHWFVGTPPTQEHIKNKLSELATNAKQELSRIEAEEEENEEN